MSVKRLRTGLAAALGGAVLLAGLLFGASLALAQDSDETDVPEESAVTDSLDRVSGLVEDLVKDPDTADELAAELDDIAADLHAEIEPFVEEIREKAFDAVDRAVDAGMLSDDEATAIKERIEAFDLPEHFPFGHHGPLLRLGLGPLSGDLDCFRFRFGPDGVAGDEDCPDFEFPEGFPFGGHDFGFGPLPEDFASEYPRDHAIVASDGPGYLLRDFFLQIEQV